MPKRKADRPAGASKTAGRGAGGQTGRAAKPPARTGEGTEAQLLAELREFAAARPAGWDHDDWLNFVEHLRSKGYDTSDRDALGRALERERLAGTLATISGVGPRRVETLVERFETLWSLRHADVDEIAALPGIPRSLAERIKQEI